MRSRHGFSMLPFWATVSVLSLIAVGGAVPAAAAGDCTITGTRSADVLRGGSGDDVICGGGGADTIYGGGGNDRLLGGDGRDRLYGGGGHDVVSGGYGNDWMVGGAGDDSFIGGSGVDAVDFSGARSVSVNLARGSAVGQGLDDIRLVEDLAGSPGVDVLVGNSAANVLLGSGGNDALRGGSGNDELVAGAGDDDLFGGEGDDALRGGPDDDLLDGGLGSDTCSGGTGTDIIKPTCDSTPPRVRSISVSPSAIDTSEGPATLVFELRATDGLAGVDKGSIILRSPSGQYQRTYWYGHHRVTGDAKDGVYRFEIPIPRYAEQGTWRLKDVWVADAVGNVRSLWTYEQLHDAGLDLSFEQLGAGDQTAPRVRSLTLSPAVVDTGAGPATIVVESRVVDDLAGIGYGQVHFRSPSGKQVAIARMNERYQTGGSALDGVYRYEMTLPRYAEQGVWQVDFVAVDDAAGNSRSYQYGALDDAGLRLRFEQLAEGDVAAPLLRSLSFSPARIDTAESSATVVVEGRVTDDLAGFRYAKIHVCSASRIHAQSFSFNTDDRISGDGNDGVYRSTLTIPQFSAPGEWFVCRAQLDDDAGNRRYMEGAALPDVTFFNGP